MQKRYDWPMKDKPMPDATTPNLLPCPFCGSIDKAIAAWNQSSTWQPIETAPRDKPLRLWGNFANNSDMPSREITGQWHEGQSAWSEWCEPPSDWVGPEPFSGIHPTHWQP